MPRAAAPPAEATSAVPIAGVPYDRDGDDCDCGGGSGARDRKLRSPPDEPPLEPDDRGSGCSYAADLEARCAAVRVRSPVEPSAAPRALVNGGRCRNCLALIPECRCAASPTGLVAEHVRVQARSPAGQCAAHPARAIGSCYPGCCSEVRDCSCEASRCRSVPTVRRVSSTAAGRATSGSATRSSILVWATGWTAATAAGTRAVVTLTATRRPADRRRRLMIRPPVTAERGKARATAKPRRKTVRAHGPLRRTLHRRRRRTPDHPMTSRAARRNFWSAHAAAAREPRSRWARRARSRAARTAARCLARCHATTPRGARRERSGRMSVSEGTSSPATGCARSRW